MTASHGSPSGESNPMSNEELIYRFEAEAVPEGSFHHADHVRLAFAYLCQYPFCRRWRNLPARCGGMPPRAENLIVTTRRSRMPISL